MICNSASCSKKDEQENEDWKQQRLDRIICDHLLRVGHYDTAEQLAKFTGIEDFTNLSIFGTSRTVEAALENHDCGLALQWCDENNARLAKLKSTLEFKLRLQEYVELVRLGKRGEAIAYASKHFKKQADRHLKDIQVAMSLLLFTKQPLHDKHKVSRARPFLGENLITLVLCSRHTKCNLFQCLWAREPS